MRLLFLHAVEERGWRFSVVALSAEVEFQPRLWKRKETLKFYTSGDRSRSPQRHASLLRVPESHQAFLTALVRLGTGHGHSWGLSASQERPRA